MNEQKCKRQSETDRNLAVTVRLTCSICSLCNFSITRTGYLRRVSVACLLWPWGVLTIAACPWHLVPIDERYLPAAFMLLCYNHNDNYNATVEYSFPTPRAITTHHSRSRPLENETNRERCSRRHSLTDIAEWVLDSLVIYPRLAVGWPRTSEL